MEARHVLDRVATIGEDEIRLGEGVFAQARQRAENVDVVDVERVGRALQALGHEPEPGEVDVVEHDRVVTLRCERGERARHRVQLAAEGEALVDQAALRELVLLVDGQREDVVSELAEGADLVAAVGGDATDAFDVEADIEDPHLSHRQLG
jgi:hypothetical protein